MNKRDFGSFHSSNAEELINKDKEQYTGPEYPFEVTTFEKYDSTPIGLKFGSATRQEHFFLEESCTFLNHGAMGAVLKEAMDVAQKWQIYTERQPLRVIDRELIPQLVYSTRRLAKFIKCDPSEVVLISNVSSALSAVVKSLQLQPGDKIFCLSVTYGALKKLLRHRCSETGAVLQEELVKFPLSGKQQIVDLIKDKLEAGTKLAVFDHIPSNTPFVMPLEVIVPLCKQSNSGNTGLKDYSAFIALRTVLDFWETIGPDYSREYMDTLIKDASNMLTETWSTDLAAPQDMFRSMSLIRLPAVLYDSAVSVDYSRAEEIQNILFHTYNIEVPIKAVQGHLYVRISAHIYNQMSDYVTLANAIMELARGKQKPSEPS